MKSLHNKFGQTKLIKKNKISFLFNGNILDNHSTKKIEEYFNNISLGLTILVIDQNNLIRNQ